MNCQIDKCPNEAMEGFPYCQSCNDARLPTLKKKNDPSLWKQKISEWAKNAPKAKPTNFSYSDVMETML